MGPSPRFFLSWPKKVTAQYGTRVSVNFSHFPDDTLFDMILLNRK
ncbi:uncharacterized protein G2W53_024118 [Senna tora]|uniref:Uncharacterized protein n=1 Tax=Senna tora TaxID=362788 RepID=A0A834TAM6_9FABA|nr:uncharacterized protein G2W53_024118 [Senna tora]